MIFKKFLYLMMAIHTCCMLGMDSGSLPSEIKIVLNDHAVELQTLLNEYSSRSSARMGANVSQKEWLPGYYIKYGIERVANAQKLKYVIDKYKLDLLSVPDKYLYHVPGRPEIESNENYLVIAKEVLGKQGRGQCINLQQVKQLCKIAVLAGHYDLHPANYVTTTDGKITIIDTDKQAMPPLNVIKLLKHDWLQYGNRIHNSGSISMDPKIINDPFIKLELPMYSKYNNYSDEAYSYLDKHIKKREQLRIDLLQKKLENPSLKS